MLFSVVSVLWLLQELQVKLTFIALYFKLKLFKTEILLEGF